MEDDKKKKKNKKKKKKQANKQTESVALDAESTSDSQSHAQEIGQNNNDQESGIAAGSNDVKANVKADRDGHLANGTEVTNLIESEQYWLDREAISERKIKDLQAEKDAQMQKEVLLEEKIRQLMKENDGNSEIEASLNDQIKRLHDEKNASLQTEGTLKNNVIQLEKEKDELIQKEGHLQQKIQQLQSDIDAHMQKEASLETRILQLEGANDSWVKKEANIEAKTNRLVDEAALLNLKVVSLEEKIKQMEIERKSWILKEDSANDSIASLTNWNTKLQAQVMELEQSRESLLNETQQLKEIISSLQLRINNFEMDNKVTLEDEDAKYQVEATRALVDRLIAENSDLVGKVNELYGMLDQRGVRTEQVTANSVPPAVAAPSTTVSISPDLTPDLAIRAVDRHITTNHSSDSLPKASKTIPISDSTQSLEDVMIKDQRNGELVSVNDGSRDSNSSEIIEADEIVQIPLDENEAEETLLEVAQNDEETDVSLTDSPLIGAPFRLISFVARYVSGADLVDKNTGKPG